MAGVESLSKQILLDAEEKAEGILQEAREHAQAVLSAAREEADKEAASTAQKAENDAADYTQRIRSQIGMQKRQTLLKAKQDLIESMIDEAKKQLEEPPDESYFAMLLSLLTKHVRPESGQMLLSARDYARKTPDFESEVQRIAREMGGYLTVEKQGQEGTLINSGFVLRYGGIEENCTLDALFQDKLEDLRDAASHVLFTETAK